MAAKKQAAPKKAEPKPPTVTERLDAIGVDVICERVANCDFLQDIADDCKVSRGSLVKWLKSEANADMYAHAREAQADKMAEDILRIADDGSNDIYETENGTATNQDVIARSRLRVDARKWLAAKMSPKKYGDKATMEVSGPDGGPIPSKTEVTFKIIRPGDANPAD